MGSSHAVERVAEALEALAAVDIDGLTDSELDEDLTALMRLAGRLDAAVCARAARWEARGIWAFDGSRSAACRLARAWTQRADAETGDDGPAPHVSTSEAIIGVGLDGETQLIAHLDPIDGALVDNALDKVMTELARDDRDAGRPARTTPQLRAAALVEIARRAMAAPAGQPARVMLRIVCDVERFARLCELSNGVVIAPGQIVPHSTSSTSARSSSTPRPAPSNARPAARSLVHYAR